MAICCYNGSACFNWFSSCADVTISKFVEGCDEPLPSFLTLLATYPSNSSRLSVSFWKSALSKYLSWMVDTVSKIWSSSENPLGYNCLGILFAYLSRLWCPLPILDFRELSRTPPAFELSCGDLNAGLRSWAGDYGLCPSVMAVTCTFSMESPSHTFIGTHTKFLLFLTSGVLFFYLLTTAFLSAFFFSADVFAIPAFSCIWPFRLISGDAISWPSFGEVVVGDYTYPVLNFIDCSNASAWFFTLSDYCVSMSGLLSLVSIFDFSGIETNLMIFCGVLIFFYGETVFKSVL